MGARDYREESAAPLDELGGPKVVVIIFTAAQAALKRLRNDEPVARAP
jgi:hypothetical protein